MCGPSILRRIFLVMTAPLPPGAGRSPIQSHIGSKKWEAQIRGPGSLHMNKKRILLISAFLIQLHGVLHPLKGNWLSHKSRQPVVAGLLPLPKEGVVLPLHKAHVSMVRALSNPVRNLGKQVREPGDQGGRLTFDVGLHVLQPERQTRDLTEALVLLPNSQRCLSQIQFRSQKC